MKYAIALLLGFITGLLLFAVGLVYNPFIGDRGLSPLSVTDGRVMTLTFSNVPSDSIAYTNDGESTHMPHPEKVLQLWEAPIRLTSTMTTVLHDARDDVAGIGVKFTSKSEETRLLNGEAMTNSVWYIYLPRQGSLFVQQTENYWRFLSEVGFSAWRSSGNNWRGTWLGDLTSGPGVLGTASVSGGAGGLAELETEAVESLTVRAFSTDTGFVAAEGRLLIEMPRRGPSAESPDPRGTLSPQARRSQ
ncbi:MAG: hypothetical protein QNJ11_04875 [Woeseiaceae bacterium]|nr:hypothetical protein [Woeseiaceae bacterium]